MTKFKKILLILLVPVALLAAATGTFIYANKVVGIYSQQNFAANGDFEKNTYGVSLSGGGSTAVSIASGGGIFGNALSITTPQNNDEVRLGISTTTGLGGLNCEARFNLKLFSTNTSPTIVDVDVISNAGTLSISNTQRVSLSADNVWVPVSVNFPCSRPVAATFGRIKIINAGVASIGTPIIYTDSFYAGEATNITNQVVVTDEQSYTPATSQGLGTLTNVDLKYWRVGSKLFVRGSFTTGTVSGSEARIDLPSGITTKADTVQNTIIGTYGRSTSSAAHGGFILKQNNVGYVLFSQANTFSGTTSIGINPDTGLTVANSSERLSVEFSVEINGWSATQSAITQQCIQDGSCENVFSAQVSSGGVVSGENIDFINGDCTGSSPYTCTFKTNFFSAAPNCEVTPISSVNTGGTFNALTTASQVFPRTKNDGSGGNENHAFSLVCQRSSTDYKPRFAAPVLVGSVTSNSQSALRIEYLQIDTNCTTSPCVVARQSSNWFTSVTRSGTGLYQVTYPSGTFSAPPSCHCSSLAVAITATNCAKNNLETMTSVGWITTNLVGAPENSSMNITCVGPR